ncbi:up-regulator of cell proliferation-like isoform X1 [Dunckerocampus dactyliophorus]|uniref:up-regulator of cell proliferation-like isoform X1 n=1 Tax=Dunckerocampus dactyliophorus TaxID=161453 RepID=UPI002404A153|nr:up-regulator of cell proliferation-like isoform X1 [Dunckerocampus dactyliophorus]
MSRGGLQPCDWIPRCRETPVAILLEVLSNLGLEKYYPNKLSLQSVLEVNKSSIYEKAVLSVDEMPFHFLRKLFQINAGCRNCTRSFSSHDETDDSLDLLDLYTACNPSENTGHPLDLIVGLFLCADSFLQQEMGLKMSLCQFSVPLLLPHTDNNQCTLMLWALREIVKEWCPHDLSQSRGFVEDSIVQARMPFFSFVRLKNCSLSKSQFVNQILSRDQQNHNMFIHRDMEGGALTRKLSNGLVEVCWFLPCGRENLDVFPEPVAFANLRGGICESLVQFTFLYEVSNAVFIFLDKVEEKEHHILKALQDAKSKLYFVVHRKESVAENMMSVQKTLQELAVPRSSVKIKDSRINTAEFSKKLCGAIKTSLCSIKNTMSIADMREKAVELGLSVDENKTLEQKKTAEEIMRGIGVRSIPHYKKQQLPLQGENWKRLSQLEKKECRIGDVGTDAVEHYKAQLQEEKKHIWEEQKQQKASQGMLAFIETLSTSNREKRHFFLKWMKFRFNDHSRDKLTSLCNKFKEQCKTKDAKLIAEVDQALLDSSLGVEHYMREMGLHYEVSVHSDDSTNKMSHLPEVAAEMLLDGYPLELLDGVASNVPEKWVTAVLMELHEKVGGKSRLLVLTVLGVQSSGKSTLLNTMFGVQFTVSSGRCTRGAYILFLKVGDDTQQELGCDFILLIDTEGLKSPELAQLEDSYEHDNQLATFVIGLSDVTIINIAMENANEMKDVLQIAVHAFLRMKEIGKKTICHFVHQNVAGVSAHNRTLTDRQHLLDQLNEMTQIAADMERQPLIQAFTDVLDYDMENNNWNIPGLWHGTPPMAPVNTGYSEAVSEFKKNLLETVGKQRQSSATKIPDFVQWMRSLWKSVKYENFIFSFRNTLVAHAYDNLCKEFNQWEWEMQKEILSRLTAAELEVVNANNEGGLETWNTLVTLKKAQLAEEIESQKSKMKEKLSDFYRKRDRHANLMEKYKTDFFNSITSLSNEIQHSVNAKLEGSLERKIALRKALDIIQEYCGTIEERVMKLLSKCKDTQLSDHRLREEFDKMWASATANVPTLKEQDIHASILTQLKRNLSNRNVSEDLQHIEDLKSFGRDTFKTRIDHVDSLMKKMKYMWTQAELQMFADNVIETSTQFVVDKTKSDDDYHDSLSRDLLQRIDESLNEGYKSHRSNIRFEIDLKLHICGIAAREFLKMHQRFLSNNDPRAQLEKYKHQYLSDFLDLYKETDHCQRKANDYVQFCIKPAIEDYMNRALGIDIVDDILTSCHSVEYSSRSCFQHNIQKELLLKDDFEAFVKYIRHYEMYVKDWIFDQVLQKMRDNTLCELKRKKLEVVVTKILNAMKEASNMLSDDNENVPNLVCKMRKYLMQDMAISEEAEKRTLFQIKSTCQSFTQSFTASLNTLKKTLHVEFSNIEDIPETLNKLAVKPQDELFKRIFGCGHQCPFCKIPCEAGGKEHKKHHAAVHRPQGLGRYRNDDNKELVETLCTTDVQTDHEFIFYDGKAEQWVPYKEYTTYYPDWHIPPDATIEASDYWKFVLVRYNKRFAQTYDAKPADVPEAWTYITKEQALKGLKDTFNMS